MYISDTSILAHAITERILKEGLAKSTWRDRFEDAFQELLTYQEDMEGDILQVCEAFEQPPQGA